VTRKETIIMRPRRFGSGSPARAIVLAVAAGRQGYPAALSPHLCPKCLAEIPPGRAGRLCRKCRGEA